MAFSTDVVSEKSVQTISLFKLRFRLHNIGLILMFLLAIAIRVYNLQAPGILPEREFRSMVISRAIYFEQEDLTPEWQ